MKKKVLSFKQGEQYTKVYKRNPNVNLALCNFLLGAPVLISKQPRWIIQLKMSVPIGLSAAFPTPFFASTVTSVSGLNTLGAIH